MSYELEKKTIDLQLLVKSMKLTQKALKLALMEFERISYQKKASPEVLEAIQKGIDHIDWALDQVKG